MARRQIRAVVAVALAAASSSTTASADDPLVFGGHSRLPDGYTTERVAAAAAAAAMAGPATDPDAAEIPVLNLIPRADWVNVKSFGAKGDGTTDDTVAIQKAVGIVTACEPGYNNATAYFPPGKYKITKQITMCGLNNFGGVGFNILGHGAASVLVWAGEKNGTMLMDNGTAYGTVSGLVFDGMQIAGIGHQHNSHNHYGSMMLHSHLAFHNLTWAGLMTAGTPGMPLLATAEVRITNCRFTNVHYGIYLKEYNDYDYAIDSCHFADNQIGIYSPHGNFDVRDSRFVRSNVTDLYTGAIPSGAHRVVSVNSTMFAIAGGWCSCDGTFVMNDCHVIGWRGSATGGWWDQWAPLPAVALTLRGPLTVMDSTFVHIPDPSVTAPPVVASWTSNLSLAVSGHKDLYTFTNETVYWGRAIIVGNLNYSAGDSAPLVESFPQDDVIIMNSSIVNTVPRAPIGEFTTFLRTWWPTATKVFDAVLDFGIANKTCDMWNNATCHTWSGTGTNKTCTLWNNKTCATWLLPTGSGQANDTEAIQKCVAAAGAAGNGAVCYLRAGSYNVYSTIVLSGQNFSIEGAGFRTMISKNPANATAWPAAANGSLFQIADTSCDVAINQMQPISREPGSPVVYMGAGAAGAKRTTRLDYLLVREAPMSGGVPCPATVKDPKDHPDGCGAAGTRCSGPSGCIDTPTDRSLRVSFVFEDLSATDTVLIDLVEAGQYWKNSAPATFLRNCGGKWTVIEAPKASALAEARDAACASTADTSSACVAATQAASTAAVGQPGFFGELMTFNSGNAHLLRRI